MERALELGLDTFGDLTEDAQGRSLGAAEVLRNLVNEAVLADEVGVDFFGVGEHHREDFAVSAPEVVLAAIAGRTSRIHVGTSVTVLSSDDPVRVFERFSTLDALSKGRAELIVGRGSFTESFALFGYSLELYHQLFEERLNLLVELLKEGPVTWRGQTRAALSDQSVHPKTESGLMTWVGVGGSPESVVRAARYHLPLMIAIIGGDPGRFRPFVDLYREATRAEGIDDLPIGVHSPGYVADSDEQAREEFWPYLKASRDRVGAERGWPPMLRESYDFEIERGSLYVGSPETVARKIAATSRLLDLTRFDLKYSAGRLPHEKALRCIELYGTKVIPAVRAMLA